jgi:hypothetical protein
MYRFGRQLLFDPNLLGTSSVSNFNRRYFPMERIKCQLIRRRRKHFF